MATKVTIVGQEPIEQEKKKIQFVYFVDSETGKAEQTTTLPESWSNIELIKRTHIYEGYDIMFAYDHDRTIGCLYLGYFNDGIV